MGSFGKVLLVLLYQVAGWFQAVCCIKEHFMINLGVISTLDVVLVIRKKFSGNPKSVYANYMSDGRYYNETLRKENLILRLKNQGPLESICLSWIFTFQLSLREITYSGKSHPIARSRSLSQPSI
jgi:hypothetical protein